MVATTLILTDIKASDDKIFLTLNTLTVMNKIIITLILSVISFAVQAQSVKDGKVMKKQKREPMPFFPGDMLMPVETFDFISLLSDNGKNSRDNVSKMEPGKYEIVLEAKPVNIKGQISPVSFRFAIK